MKIKYLPHGEFGKLAQETVQAYLAYAANVGGLPTVPRCALCGSIEQPLYVFPTSPYWALVTEDDGPEKARGIACVVLVLACENHGIEDVGLFVEEHVTSRSFTKGKK